MCDDKATLKGHVEACHLAEETEQQIFKCQVCEKKVNADGNLQRYTT